MYYMLPMRRRLVMQNLHRVFDGVLSEKEIRRLAQAYYGHFARFVIEFLRLPFTSDKQRKQLVRVENKDAAMRAWEQGKGVILLTGHFEIGRSPQSQSSINSRSFAAGSIPCGAR